ncbi:hypothetical protein NP493_163g02060 [Ridgeia piscesae]|uniref:Tubulin polyglutamylase TTLL7 n=1 Tax=Ridgeia piscesae TaxID=27915 RepID=A0AAD9UFG1_RIDPI|nr:hypothetical protein NP493_163g02060 [Ridgeia piscesae]
MPVAAPMQLRSRVSSAASISSIDREVPQVNATGSGYTKGRSALSSHTGRARHAVEHVSKAIQVNGKGKKRRRKPPITAHLGGTRYDIVRIMVEQCGFVISEEDDANCFVSTERISELKPYQKINHFPGMGEICRKDCLARNIAKMCKIHPEEYQILPKTWIFPSEYGIFQNYARELRRKKKNRTFIVKPANGAMGNGISLYRLAEKIPQNDHTVVQEYIDRPFLVEQYKCDMRIYALVTSCDPLKIFLYNDGLLRMGTEKYVQPSEVNLDHLFMHLTNYSVNKHSETYEKSGTVDTGSKRSLRYFNQYLRHHDYDVGALWQSITDVIIKTLIVAQPHVLHAYRMCRPGQPVNSDSVCFEILGFDIIVDRKLRPWLLEV